MGRMKHIWHCQQCDSPCKTYKKGKGHRLLVCPIHGIIASNPSGIGAALGTAIGTALLPGVGTVGGEIVGNLAEEALTGAFTKKPKSATMPTMAHHPTNFERAVALEELETRRSRHGKNK